MSAPGRRPARTPALTPAELARAAGMTTSPLVAPGLRVLFCGINPSLRTAWTGHHFAHPANRFWVALHLSGFTPRRLAPAEQHELLALGLGVTNVASRASARASELDDDELRAGGRRLVAEVEELRPRWLAVLGVTAYRTAFAERRAVLGRQERTIGDTQVWVLPNPSGLNAHHTPAQLGERFAELRAEVDGSGPPDHMSR